jgi:DNA-binding CsgD family transcriptional regulator
MSIDSQQFDSLLCLIEDVYDAALDDQRWSDLAPRIARAFESTSTSLQIQRQGVSSNILCMTENVASGIEDYRGYYWRRDIWVERALKLLGPSKVGSSKDMVTDAEFRESEFFRDWCRHLDVFYVVGAVFPAGRGELGVLGIHRPRSSGNYEEDDKALVARFLPHLQRALRVRTQLGQATLQGQLSREALERSETGTLLVTADGLIVFANTQAEALMATGGGIRSAKGRLTAVRMKEAERLTELIREASSLVGHGDQGDGVMSIQRVNQQPLSLLVAPFRLTWTDQPAAGAIVFVRDPHKLISATFALRALFGLTPVEARIAQALANGKTINEIATDHCTHVQTVRKQTKTVFAKTGTKRQAECVAVILRSIAAIARESAIA